ncbi:hypothetical protein Tco_0008576 [Tanacetum coccineum]
MASAVASLVVSGCGDVILDLLRGGNISDGNDAGTSGDGGSDDDMHLLGDGECGGDGDGNDRNDDLYLLQGGAAISSVIAASMDSGRVNGGRTIFPSVRIIRTPLRCGNVILDLLRDGNISNGGDAGISGDGGSDGDLHLLQDGEGGGDGDGDDSNGDLYISHGGEAISSAITALMDGGRVNGNVPSSSVCSSYVPC